MTVAQLIYAIGVIESGWNCAAVGAQGEVGPLQVHQVTIDELNRLRAAPYGDNWQLARCREPGYAIHAFRAYMDAKAGGRSPERMARIWRKGPTGQHSETARRYWVKVKQVMDGRKGARQ